MRVAVTGASGFIGRHVLAELEHCSVEIVAVTRDAMRLHDLSPGISIVELDIAVAVEDSFVRMGCPDVLIHLAWEGLSNYNSLHHIEVELPKHYKFIKMLVEAGLSSLLIAGTCLEYGMQSGALSEEITTCPSTSYGYAKDALRKQLEFIKSETSFKLVWGRLFYLFGDNQPSNSLYSSLRAALLRGDPVFNMSAGEQLRDYMSVTEMARKIVRLALSGIDVGTVNICSGTPISVRRLVEQWLTEYNREMHLNLGYFPYPDYEPLAFWGEDTKLQKILRSISES